MWLYATYVVIVVLRRLKKGLQNSLSNRITILRRSQTYVLGYVAIGLLTLSLEIALFLFHHHDSGAHENDVDDEGHQHDSLSHQILRTTIAVLDACTGVVSFFILFIPNREELRAYFLARGGSRGLVAEAVLEELSLKPHLNSALRAEILYLTTLVRRFYGDFAALV